MPRKKPGSIPRLTDDEITEVVTEFVKGRIFTGTMCPPELLGMVFMPLSLANIDLREAGNVYEHMDKALPNGINGYPIFTSCRPVHKADWAIIVERATKAHDAMTKAATGK